MNPGLHINTLHKRNFFKSFLGLMLRKLYYFFNAPDYFLLLEVSSTINQKNTYQVKLKFYLAILMIIVLCFLKSILINLIWISIMQCLLMSKNRLISNQFEEHIRFIVETFVSKISGIESIILYGGYGRGEGVWIESNGSYNPYNDYDILIVLRDIVKIPKNISKIKEQLLKKINIQWIDVSFIHLRSLLNNRSKTIFWYDLIHGSKVIFGDTELLKKIPNIDSSEIEIKEGKLLFFTRLWPFVGGVEVFKELNPNEALFYRYQMAKVVLASVDMLLLMRSKYVSSYEDRHNIAINICQRNNLIGQSLFKWAISQKLNPSNEVMNEEDVIKLQKDVAKLFSNYALQVLSQVYKKEFISVIQFITFYSRSFSDKSKIIIGWILRKGVD